LYFSLSNSLDGRISYKDQWDGVSTTTNASIAQLKATVVVSTDNRRSTYTVIALLLTMLTGKSALIGTGKCLFV
jgi:hypothetical protein